MPGLLADIGTIEWCRTTKGILSPRERVRFMAAVTLEIARTAPRLLASKAGLRGGGPDPSRFTLPDTAFTRSVLEACRELDPMLVEHGYRSYLFSLALGEVAGLSCDHEALFAAALLHDYAFASIDTIDDRCFTLAGAEVAAELLVASPLSAALQHDVLDAITLHANPRVPPTQGTLQHLLHAGVMVDVVGLRAWELDWPGIERVVLRHPRHDFMRRGEPILREHARRVPNGRGRAAFQCGFSAALRLGPWQAYESERHTRPIPSSSPGE